MIITILGCGASAGVPLIGCRCKVCVSPNPKNRRTRVSVLVESGTTRLLIDTSPDLRQQALANDIQTVDAILYTHDHADHTHGIDETRSFNFHAGKATDIYADGKTLEGLQQRFSYAFKPPRPEFGWFRPCLIPHLIEINNEFRIGEMKIMPFRQLHGTMNTLGFRIGDFAYSTDTNELPQESLKLLEGVDTWIVDCLKPTPAPTHAHLDRTLQWIAWVKPRRAVLTHMGHEFDYDQLAQILPEGVTPGYDGMSLEI